MLELAVSPTMTTNDAVKVDALCARVIGDLGSICMRITPPGESVSEDVMALRKFVRTVQDTVRDRYPGAFFK